MAHKNKNALVQLAETMADNKYVMGNRLVEVGVSGPTIEATLSSISLSQGELSHARLLYRWSNDMQGLQTKKVKAVKQPEKVFPQMKEATNWIELIVGLYVNNVAIQAVLREIMKNKQQELNLQFSKLMIELEDHLTYAKEWCHLLIHDKGSIPKKFVENVERAVQPVEKWLNEVENNKELQQLGVISQDSNLTSLFKETIATLPVTRTGQRVS